MPSVGGRYVNRSAEHRAREKREQQKRLDSWERMKAQIAAKYAS